MSAIAIILNGASSSGKTSIAKAMQRIWPSPLIHASLDAFTDVFDWSSIDDADRRRECHRFGIESFHTYLSSIATSKHPVVVDHVFEQREWYESTREAFRQRTAFFVAVRCSLSTLEAREKARGDRRIGLSRWQHLRVHEAVTYDLEIDTDTMSVHECAKAIMDYSTQREAEQSPRPIR